MEYLRTNKASKEIEFLREQEVRRMQNDIDSLEKKNEILFNNLKELSGILEEINTKI
jgi:hypothetical protein